MNDWKFAERMTESLLFEIDGKRVKFPNKRLDICKQGGKIILDYFRLTQVQFLSGKSDVIFINLFHNLF